MNFIMNILTKNVSKQFENKSINHYKAQYKAFHGEIEVTAIDPVVSMLAVDNLTIQGIAGEIQRKLKTFIYRTNYVI